MSSSHMKRLTMPRSWPLPRKTSVWVQKPDPCGHPLELCMPVGIVLRDILGVAETRREAKQIVADSKVKVDGTTVTTIGRAVGLMDVLTVGDDHYRCILDSNGRLRYRPISAAAAASKPCRIDAKTTVSGGRTQLNLHDGRNIIIEDPNSHSTGDTVLIDVQSQAIQKHHALESGATIYLIGGSHVGVISTLNGVIKRRSSMPNEVELDGFIAVADHVFVIGSAKDLPLEVDA